METTATGMRQNSAMMKSKAGKNFLRKRLANWVSRLLIMSIFLMWLTKIVANSVDLHFHRNYTQHSYKYFCKTPTKRGYSSCPPCYINNIWIFVRSKTKYLTCPKTNAFNKRWAKTETAWTATTREGQLPSWWILASPPTGFSFSELRTWVAFNLQ